MSPGRDGSDGVVIRAAVAGDLPAIICIENEAFTGDRIAPRSFRRLIESRSASVLVADGRMGLLGCCVVLFRAYSRRARLYSLAVLRAAAGRGLGSRLLGAAEDAARARDCTAIGLEVRADNGSAIALYEKRSYALLGQTPDYYSDGTTALHFRKSLGAVLA